MSTKDPKTKTSYVVLMHDGPNVGNTWEEVGVRLAHSSEQACREAAQTLMGANDDIKPPIRLVAVPARSFQSLTFDVQPRPSVLAVVGRTTPTTGPTIDD